MSPEALAKGETRVTSNKSRVTPPCHCEGVRSTLKTLSYDCGNPVIICLRAFARSAFYSLDRHASLAMTRGTNCPIPRFLCHSRVFSRHTGEGRYPLCSLGYSKLWGMDVYSHHCGSLLYQWFPACYHPTNTFVFVGARCRDDGVSMHVTSASRALLPPRPNHPRDTPRGTRCVGHPSNGGELGSYRRGTSSPLRRGGGLPPGWFITRSLGEGWSITSNELRVTSN